MTMTSSSRTVKNRSWRRLSRAPTVAWAVDLDLLSG